MFNIFLFWIVQGRKCLLILTLIVHTWFIGLSQVVINEVHMQPAGSTTGTNPQNLADCTPNNGAEYIELYNTDPCNVADISCYIVGCNIAGTSAAAHGAFRFPQGTIIPPLGFVSIGGTNSGATFVLNNYCGTANLNINPAGRWYMPNGDGYMMLYNSSGAAIDAVYWTINAGEANKWGTDTDINTNPTRIPAGTGGCQLVNSLSGPANLPLSFAEYAGQASGNGFSTARQTDGGSTWVRNVAGTINGCNGACIVSTPFLLNIITSAPSCNSANGSITITPSTMGSYSYSWTPNVSTSNVATNLAAGAYQISVTLNGCTVDTIINLTSTSGPTSVAVSTVNSTCGQGNGSVSIGAVTGGTPPFTYNFDNLGYSSTSNFSNLPGGVYSLLVKDATGCVYSAPNIILTSSPSPSNILFNSTNPTCGQSNGSVILGQVTGGTSPYTYNFNNLGFGTNTSFSNLGAGSFSLEISDALGCTFSAPDILLTNNSGPTGVLVTPTNPSCGQSDGVISLGVVTGGTAPYTYNFDGLGFSGTTVFSNLSGGSYTLEVKDAAGCVFVAPIVTLVTPNGPSAIAVTTTNPSCGLADGAVIIGTVTGGTAPYTYNFNNQGFSGVTTYANLNAGSYGLEVKDSNGCLFLASSVVLTNTNAPSAIVVNVTNSTCSQSNGVVDLSTVTGGTAPYSYNFNNLGFSSVTNYTGLMAGTYTLQVQDNIGCVFVAPSINITTSAGPNTISVFSTDPSCNQTNGSVNLGNVSGGTPPFNYNFNNQGPSSNINYSNLSAGTYSLVVVDALGCVYNAPSITLNTSNGPSGIVVNVIDPLCGQSNGSVDLGLVSGGVAPFVYNFNGIGFQPVTSFSDLPAGTYSLEVSDASGCIFIAPTINLSSSDAPNGVEILVTNTLCGQANGSVILGNVFGGVSPYLFSFDNLPFSSNSSFTILDQGSYAISIKDSNNCVFDTTISVMPSSGITSADVSISPMICLTENGSISIGAILGGVPPYQFQLNGQGFTSNPQFNNLPEGLYSITVKDSSGCELNLQKNVTQDFSSGPQSLSYSLVSPDCDASNGSLSVLNVVGGTSPLSYSFSGIQEMIDSTYSNLDTGWYQIQIIDSNGCVLSDSVLLLPNGMGDVYIPNTFTPNKDNKNENWFISGYCVKQIDCIIFNRWGEYVARLDNANPSWDGIYNGQLVQEGIYVYSALITFYSNDTKSQMGHILISY